MDKVIFKKIRSFSIVETIVSMTIITILFLTVTVLFVKIITPSSSLNLINIHEVLVGYSKSSLRNRQFNDEEIKIGSYEMIRKQIDVDTIPGLKHIQYRMVNQDSTILDQIDEIVNVETN